MSIEIRYLGGFGNRLSAYIWARLLAIKNNLYLETSFPDEDIKYSFPGKEILSTTPHESGRIFKEPIEHIIDVEFDYNGPEYFDKKLDPAHYIVEGFFQEANYYNDSYELIKTFFNLDPIKKNTKDIVMVLRLADFYREKLVINPGWYKSILNKEEYDNIYVVGCDHDDHYLDYFKEYNLKVIQPTNNIGEDFHFIRSFDKIICSNSSLHWWASFLSEASTIYTFKKFAYNSDTEQDSNRSLMSNMRNATVIKGRFYKGKKPKTDFSWIPVRKKQG